ncbi:MAG: YlmC/YmxH family sporulation protein [Oscillospiraceae bacterium]|nr:YlmC/YmxH family sporulation protein [Oscillospiraceae bacterium]MBQ6973723.1 YlmC/YmxH family sporulation protein [Oscillospiraceae bacterium]
MRYCQLRRKEVINLNDGCRLGYVGDLELCMPEGTVKALIVLGPCKFFGLFGRGEDYYIPWDCVQRFGDDIILIDKPFQRRDGPGHKKKKPW